MRAKIILDEQLKYIGESDHTQKAIDVFGTTYYRTRAGFMLKNGKLLDLTYDGGPREDHRNIRDAFDDMDLDSESDYLIEFMNEGNIRLIPEIPGIDITVEPTDKQYAALKDYINFFIGRNKYFGVQFSNKNGDQVDWKEYNGLVSYTEIILDIKDYFKNKLVENWYDDFSWSTHEPSWSAHEPQTVSELLNTDTLYHATYKPYWEEIKKEGFIKPGKHSNWSDIFKTYRYIYLSTDYDNAYSYAETAEDAPEELLDQIVVLEIDANKLDVDSLRADENQIYDSDEDEGRSIEDPLTWVELEYDKPIPVSAVRKVHDESIVNEGYLDPEEKFYDYRTGEANLKSCDIFDKTKTGFSFYNNLIDDPEYMKKSKGLVGSIVMMTPNEYFEHCGEIFHTSKQTQIDHTLADKNNIEYLKQVILKYNRKFPIGYINIRDKQQEGRHRMAVAGELCGYDTPQPVLIAQDINNILYPDELILREDYYNKIDLSSNSSDEDIIKSIKDQFKTFDNPLNITYGGYYILPSGEFLQAQNHLDIDKWLMRWGYIKKQSTDFADGSQYMEVKLNCIRVRCRGGKDDWLEPYVVLPKNRLTISQKYSLLAWLDFIMLRKEKVLIHTEVNNEFVAYDLNDYTSDEIINKIDRYYTTGKLLK